MTKGFLLLLGSSLAFTLSTVFGKIVVTISDVPAVEITFFRFIAGFAFMALYIPLTGRTFRANNMRYITSRGIFNSGAVILFFLALEYTTVTKTNLLNMTYPVFVFAIAGMINREKIRPVYYLYLILTVAGLMLVMAPDMKELRDGTVNAGDVIALASAVFAAFAITTLRQATKYDATHTILFYMLGIGTIINLPFAIPGFRVPHGAALMHTVLATVSSLAGQVFITIGFRDVEAAAGSLVQASRIIFSILLGVWIFNDPVTWKIITGAAIILVSLAGVGGIFTKQTGRDQ